ncbi:unnamed protein product, partial [Bubo scandiacus]
RHSSGGDPDVFSAAWEGNEKQNDKTARFTHSWAVLAAAVSQRHPSNVLGDRVCLSLPLLVQHEWFCGALEEDHIALRNMNLPGPCKCANCQYLGGEAS